MDSASHPSTGEVVLMATSSAVTAILYAVYRHKSKVADSLKVSGYLDPGLRCLFEIPVLACPAGLTPTFQSSYRKCLLGDL